MTHEVLVADMIDALGMESGDILDCQITASIDNGVGVPKHARPNTPGSKGWVTVTRGPPLYQNEYIQVIDISQTCQYE